MMLLSNFLPATPPGTLGHCATGAFVGLQQTRSRPVINFELLLCTQFTHEQYIFHKGLQSY
jgi:hypothetical protein